MSASTLRRSGLTTALDRMAAGDADVLVVAKLDRLSRSLRDFIDPRDRDGAGGWGVVLLDVDLDMSTPSGQLTSNTVASVGELERALISARTRDALAEARKRGVRLGRPPEIPEHVFARIRGRRAAGDSLRKIAGGSQGRRHPHRKREVQLDYPQACRPCCTPRDENDCREGEEVIRV